MPSPYDKIKLTREQDRRARFTDADAEEIRKLYSEGWTQRAIAEKYGTCQSAVCYIVSDGAHKRLAEYRRENPPKRRTNEEAREYLKELRRYKRSLVESGMVEGQHGE